MWTLDVLKRTDPHEFELLVGELFRQMGYTTEVTAGSGDGGRDLLVELSQFGLSHRWIVQVKRYEGSVGVRDVREYSSLRDRDKVDGVIIVTTGVFTKEAVQEASGYNVKLVDGLLLVSMLNKYMPDKSLAVPPAESTDAGDLILKQGEHPLLTERVRIDGESAELVLTARNIFLRTEEGLIFRDVKVQRIGIEDVVGMHMEDDALVLIQGGRQLKLCRLRCRDADNLLDNFEKVRSARLGGERLLRLEGERGDYIILTNRRLISLARERQDALNLRSVSLLEAGTEGIIFRTGKLTVHTSDGKSHVLRVEDAEGWKQSVESAVRAA
ncbi:MAG TPA: restriction endonuclease [Candidatus Methanoperedenaceae archaeon]|nr:restriction endonuclease [Candidatus Methanoperedenaceae archaeon]